VQEKSELFVIVVNAEDKTEKSVVEVLNTCIYFRFRNNNKPSSEVLK